MSYTNNAISNGYTEVVLTQSATNNTEEDITVNEIGVFRANSENSTEPKLLVTRNVIEPVTIKPGETKTFTIKIDFSKFSDAYSAS